MYRVHRNHAANVRIVTYPNPFDYTHDVIVQVLKDDKWVYFRGFNSFSNDYAFGSAHEAAREAMQQHPLPTDNTTLKVGKMGKGVAGEGEVGTVQQTVVKGIDQVGFWRYGVEVAVVEFFDDHDGAIGDRIRPLLQFIGYRPDHLLHFGDLADLRVGMTEILTEPFPAFNGFGEIEQVEQGIFLLRMEDGQVVQCGLIDLHMN